MFGALLFPSMPHSIDLCLTLRRLCFYTVGLALESTSIMRAVAGQLGSCSIINGTIVILTLCRPAG